MKYLYTKNYKTFMKEIEGTNKWNDFPCSWTERINIIKMPILPKAIFRFVAIPIKILMAFLIEIRENSPQISFFKILS